MDTNIIYIYTEEHCKYPEMLHCHWLHLTMTDLGYCCAIQSNTTHSKTHRYCFILSLLLNPLLSTHSCVTPRGGRCVPLFERGLSSWLCAVCLCVCACVGRGYCVCFWHLVSSDWRLKGLTINSVSSFSSKQTKSLCFNCYSSEADWTFNGAACQALCQGFFLLPLISFYLYMF